MVRIFFSSYTGRARFDGIKGCNIPENFLLLIPKEPSYWLYMICDNFAIRVVIAGLLVGIG